MDRNRTQAFVSSLSVSAHRVGSSKLLLRSSKARRSRTAANEEDRRDLHGLSVLWLEENSHRAEKGWLYGQPEKSTRAYEGNGVSRHSSWTKHFSQEYRAQGVPIPAKRPKDSRATEGMEHRHHLHPIAEWIRVSSGHHGLVQQDGSSVSSFEQPGSGILSRCFRRSFERAWKTRDFQYGSRSTIYLCRVCRGDYNTRHTI